jgi:hypothetical protein
LLDPGGGVDHELRVAWSLRAQASPDPIVNPVSGSVHRDSVAGDHFTAGGNGIVQEQRPLEKSGVDRSEAV